MFIWPVFLLKHSILGYGNQAEIYILPAIAYAIYHPVSLIKRKGTVNHLHTLLLGMSFGWILMLKFNYALLYAAPGFILLWVLCRQRKWKDICLSVVIGLSGIIIAIFPGILYLWKNDILSYFYNIYIVFNFKYASSSSSFPFSNFLRIFKCWSSDNQPNNLVRLIILFPWLAILIFCVKNKHCDKDDKKMLGFILATFLLNAPTWLGRKVYSYYFIPLTLPALLAYAFVFQYTLPLANDFISGIKKRMHPFIWTTARKSLLLFIGIIFLLKVSLFLKEMKHPHIFIWEKDTNLCELLDQNDRRILVVGSLCFAYCFYNAKPDCRYLYQCPISNVTPVIWDELLKDIQFKATPLILVQEENLKYIPAYFMAFLHENYEQMDCRHGFLFVLPPLKRQI